MLRQVSKTTTSGGAGYLPMSGRSCEEGQWRGVPARTRTEPSPVTCSTTWSSRMWREPSRGERASPVGHCSSTWLAGSPPRQGSGRQRVLWPWWPISVWMMPCGSTMRMLVPSAMYMVRSAAMARPLGCASRAFLAGPRSPQCRSSPGGKAHSLMLQAR